MASGHREAPAIAKAQYHDTTDVFGFISTATGNLVLAASWIPFQEPAAGPNYYEWDDQATYAIEVDNNGDGAADVSYELTTTTEVKDDSTFLYASGPVTAPFLANWNRRQRVTVIERRGASVTTLVDNRLAAPVNIGAKLTPDYPSLMQAAVFVATAGADTIKVFAGQTDDAYFGDLQFFDLLTLRGQSPPVGYSSGSNDPIDTFGGFNVHSLVIEVPVARVTDGDPVIGVWATTVVDGAQVSRMGMPHFNQLVLGMGLKDTFNTLSPSSDLGIYSLLQPDVEDPEVATLLCTLYGLTLPADASDACHSDFDAGSSRSGRGDVFDIFMQGMILANPFTADTANGPVNIPAGFNINRQQSGTVAEVLRINTAISGDTCAPTPARLGLLGGDLCGFPNGRRPVDDVLDITLLVMAGAAYQLLDDRDAGFSFNADLLQVLTDRVNANDRAFQSDFPYLAVPHSGQDRMHFMILIFKSGFEALIETVRKFKAAFDK